MKSADKNTQHVNELADFGDPYTNFFMSRRFPERFVEDKNVQQKKDRVGNRKTREQRKLFKVTEFTMKKAL